MGTERTKAKSFDVEWIPFDECRELARSLGVRSGAEWVAHWRANDRPENVPSTPDRAYKDAGWTDWYDFLGNVRFSYEECRDFVRGLGITTLTEWKEYWRNNERPYGVPYKPDRTYRDAGWTNWPDFLGTSKKTK